jgi:hypothetical protein
VSNNFLTERKSGVAIAVARQCTVDEDCANGYFPFLWYLRIWCSTGGSNRNGSESCGCERHYPQRKGGQASIPRGERSGKRLVDSLDRHLTGRGQ